MTYLSVMQRNIFLAVSIIIFSILILLDGFDGLWTLSWFLLIYSFFVIIPVLKNLYYENGTWIQKIVLSILFVLITVSVFLNYDVFDLNGVIISLFLILFLNYTSTTLQISPKYHPIISISYIGNIIIVILALTAFIISIIWNLDVYYDTQVSYILLILLVISSFLHDIKYKKQGDI